MLEGKLAGTENTHLVINRSKYCILGLIPRLLGTPGKFPLYL